MKELECPPERFSIMAIHQSGRNVMGRGVVEARMLFQIKVIERFARIDNTKRFVICVKMNHATHQITMPQKVAVR